MRFNPHLVLHPSVLTGPFHFEIPMNGLYIETEGFEISRDGIYPVYYGSGSHAE